MSNNVVFRRVRGHVVPIKMKSGGNVNVTHHTVQGVAETAGGAVIAALAGNKAHQLLRKAADIERLGKLRASPNKVGQLSLFKSRGADKLFKLATRFHRARNIALLAGGAIGGALITKGVHDIIKDNPKLKEHPGIEKAATITGGFGLASTVAAAAYGKKLMPTQTFKKIIEYAKARKTIQYTLRGL